MNELKIIRDPIIQLFMEVDLRIINVKEQIIQYKNISNTDLRKLINDKQTLLNIFKKPNQINYDNIWSANNLIYKIDYILEVYELINDFNI